MEAVPSGRLLRWATGPFGHRFDRWLVRRTGVSLISWLASRGRGIGYQQSLLLITRGRKSGEARPVVLPYVRDGGRLVVVASNAGRARQPAWVGNLVAEPDCSVVVDRRERTMRACLAQGADRDRLLDVIAAERPQVFNYEELARRRGRVMAIGVLQAPDTTG